MKRVMMKLVFGNSIRSVSSRLTGFGGRHGLGPWKVRRDGRAASDVR